MSAFTFGQPVSFTWHLSRHPVAQEGRLPTLKRWSTRRWEWEQEPEPRDGIVIGVRHLANGENRGGYGWDDPIVFRATEHFTAYLVAYDMRRKPVLVLPEHMTPRQAVTR